MRKKFAYFVDTIGLDFQGSTFYFTYDLGFSSSIEDALILLKVMKWHVNKKFKKKIDGAYDLW